MGRDRPYYSLKVVRNLAINGPCLIKAEARMTARKAFGWGESEIRKAMAKLALRHFYKSGYRYDNPTIHVDYYKADGLLGERVYTHFRVENGELVICSFKEI